MAKQNILARIKEGSIKTNFSQFPETLNGFTREDTFIDDAITECKINYVGYSRGNNLGYVTAADLAAGRLQVRKIDTVQPETGRKVAVPSERVW